MPYIKAELEDNIVVDSALSSTSENPVQNKVIDTALSSKRTTGSYNDQNDTVTFTSNDVSSDSSATSWISISKFTSGEMLKNLFGKISSLAYNVRYLKNNIPPKASVYYTDSFYSWYSNDQTVSSKYCEKGIYVSVASVGVTHNATGNTANAEAVVSDGSKSASLSGGDFYNGSSFGNYGISGSAVLISSLSSGTTISLKAHFGTSPAPSANILVHGTFTILKLV